MTHLYNYSQIVKLSLELLSYDPNYNYESDDEDEGMDTDELEQDELYGFSGVITGSTLFHCMQVVNIYWVLT